MSDHKVKFDHTSANKAGAWKQYEKQKSAYRFKGGKMMKRFLSLPTRNDFGDGDWTAWFLTQRTR